LSKTETVKPNNNHNLKAREGTRIRDNKPFKKKATTNGTTNPSTTKVDNTKEEEPPTNGTTRKRRSHRCLNTLNDNVKGGPRHLCTIKGQPTTLLHNHDS
jgi:hypothetical protein